jgi:hypothetical protein
MKKWICVVLFLGGCSSVLGVAGHFPPRSSFSTRRPCRNAGGYCGKDEAKDSRGDD